MIDWLHPHWFMRWLTEAGIWNILAAVLTFYAARTALRIASDNRRHDTTKDENQLWRRRASALLALEYALKPGALASLADGPMVDQLRATFRNSQTALAFGLSQDVPSVTLVEMLLKTQLTLEVLVGSLDSIAPTKQVSPAGLLALCTPIADIEREARPIIAKLRDEWGLHQPPPGMIKSP